MQQGDNDAFAELYEGTRRGLFSFLYDYYRDFHKTEDAVQWVYLRIKQNVDKYTPGTSGINWMLSVAKNYALNELKRDSRIEYGLPEETEGVGFDDGCISELMSRVLSHDEVQIMILHVIFGYKHREISRIMDIPQGTVTSKYKRSLDKMRSAISEIDGSTSDIKKGKER